MDKILESIEKPTLLLDEDIVRRNIRRMADRARSAGVVFRPHFKTHQSAEIGSWFRAEGVHAITVSSIDMAFYFSQHGWDDITIAFPVNIRQRKALSELARTVRLGILVESSESAQAVASSLDAPADVWLKVDTGLHRTGLAWDQPGPVEVVARAVISAPNLRLRGLLTHGGQTYGAHGAGDVCYRYHESVDRIQRLRQSLTEQGVGSLEISVGDTPGTSLCADLGPVDEIRPGNFVFYDAQQILIGSCGWQDVAVAVACPVVARHPERGEIIIYGGAIHFSKDYTTEGDHRGYGLVCLPDPQTGRWSAPLPGAWVSGLSQEHGVIHMPIEDIRHIQVGDLVCILPAHSCLTVTLMKRYLTFTGQTIETLNA